VAALATDPVRGPRNPAPVAVAEPRGAFTIVRRGESLSDVSKRVYGNVANATDIWTANRDVLDREDSPLRAGTMLRTP
jgi:nucleoid-associated protein YgaU